MSRRRRNVKAVLGTPTDPGLPSAGIDLALMVDVYHELEYPTRCSPPSCARSSRRAAGVRRIQERDASVPIKPLHTMSEAQVRKEAAVHALQWVKSRADLPCKRRRFPQPSETDAPVQRAGSAALPVRSRSVICCVVVA